MKAYWWQDKIDSQQRWHSLQLRVNPPLHGRAAAELLSGHNARMQLQLNGHPLFWATVLRAHCGVWLICNQDHPQQHNLLSPVRSHTVQQLIPLSLPERHRQWCRFFARDLLARNTPLLSAGNWLLRPAEWIPPAAPYRCGVIPPPGEWRFRSAPDPYGGGADWQIYGCDFPDLLQIPPAATLADWWDGGGRLLPRYAVDPRSSRLKYWRKLARARQLPPVLVWYISGLASYLILDGHLRLQAAIAETIPPEFIILSQYHESRYEPDPAAIAKTEKSIAHQLINAPRPDICNINRTLIRLYQNRYGRCSTYSRAALGDGKAWESQVSRYLHNAGCSALVTPVIQRGYAEE